MYILSQAKQPLTFDYSTCKNDYYPFCVLIVTIIHSCSPSTRSSRWLFNSDMYTFARKIIIYFACGLPWIIPVPPFRQLFNSKIYILSVQLDNDICKKDYFIILRADYHESSVFPFQAAFHLQIQVTLQILSTDKGNKLRHCLDKKYTLGLFILFALQYTNFQIQFSK